MSETYVVSVFRREGRLWVGAYVAFTGRPVYRLVNMLPDRRWLGVLLTIAVAGWAWKILIHLTGHDPWPL